MLSSSVGECLRKPNHHSYNILGENLRAQLKNLMGWDVCIFFNAPLGNRPFIPKAAIVRLTEMHQTHLF